MEIKVISNKEKTPNLLRDIVKVLNNRFQKLGKDRDKFENSFNRFCLEIAKEFDCKLYIDEGKPVFISNVY